MEFGDGGETVRDEVEKDEGLWERRRRRTWNVREEVGRLETIWTVGDAVERLARCGTMKEGINSW